VWWLHKLHCTPVDSFLGAAESHLLAICMDACCRTNHCIVSSKTTAFTGFDSSLGLDGRPLRDIDLTVDHSCAIAASGWLTTINATHWATAGHPSPRLESRMWRGLGLGRPFFLVGDKLGSRNWFLAGPPCFWVRFSIFGVWLLHLPSLRHSFQSPESAQAACFICHNPESATCTKIPPPACDTSTILI